MWFVRKKPIESLLRKLRKLDHKEDNPIKMVESKENLVDKYYR